MNDYSEAQSEPAEAERLQRMRRFLMEARTNAARTAGSPEELEAEAIAITDEVRNNAFREGLAAAERGEMKPAGQVYAEMRARYGIPDQDHA